MGEPIVRACATDGRIAVHIDGRTVRLTVDMPQSVWLELPNDAQAEMVDELWSVARRYLRPRPEHGNEVERALDELAAATRERRAWGAARAQAHESADVPLTEAESKEWDRIYKRWLMAIEAVSTLALRR